MYQEFSEVRLDKGTQEGIIISMAASPEVMEFSRTRMREEDFDWCTAKAVAAALCPYYETYRQLPSMQVLSMEVKRLVTGTGPRYVEVPEVERGRLLNLLKAISKSRKTGCDVGWSKDAITQYLKQLRLHRFGSRLGRAVNTGVGVDEVISDAAKLASETAADDDEVLLGDLFDVTALAQTSAELKHVATGIPDIDATLGGGPMPGELGLVIACQGIGKTNIMTNAAVTSAMRREYNLIISAEMPRGRLVPRVFSMAGCVPYSLFRNTGFQELEQKYKDRIQLVQNLFSGKYLQCADFSAKQLTYNDLVRVCMEWREWIEDNNLVDQMGFVCIDYLDLIQFSGNTGGDLNDLDPKVIAQMMKSFRKDVISKHDLCGIIAGQATSAAEGKMILDRKDVAWAYHSNDAVHYSMGLADKADSRLKAVLEGDDPDSISQDDSHDVTKHGSYKVVSFMKMRDGSRTAFEVYQAPTLRFYKSKREYNMVKDAVDGGAYDIITGGMSG